MTAMEAQEVDFAVISEDYSRYLLHDGTQLKVKIVLKKIFFAPVSTPEGYPSNVGLDTMNAIVAIVPHSLKRKPSNDFNQNVDKGTEIKFEEGEVKMQEYMTTKGFRVSIKPVLLKVFKYDKYNSYGEPIYNAVIQSITNIDKIQSTAT